MLMKNNSASSKRAEAGVKPALKAFSESANQLGENGLSSRTLAVCEEMPLPRRQRNQGDNRWDRCGASEELALEADSEGSKELRMEKSLPKPSSYLQPAL